MSLARAGTRGSFAKRQARSTCARRARQPPTRRHNRQSANISVSSDFLHESHARFGPFQSYNRNPTMTRTMTANIPGARLRDVERRLATIRGAEAIDSFLSEHPNEVKVLEQ